LLPSPPLPPPVNYYLAAAAPPLVYRGTYCYGTAFDHHALSRSAASIAFADPARAGSVRMTYRAGRRDTAS